MFHVLCHFSNKSKYPSRHGPETNPGRIGFYRRDDIAVLGSLEYYLFICVSRLVSAIK